MTRVQEEDLPSLLEEDPPPLQEGVLFLCIKMTYLFCARTSPAQIFSTGMPLVGLAL